jgi:hypothetical protein
LKQSFCYVAISSLRDSAPSLETRDCAIVTQVTTCAISFSFVRMKYDDVESAQESEGDKRAAICSPHLRLYILLRVIFLLLPALRSFVWIKTDPQRDKRKS